ncbi:MAG: endolytic transglycosylase MltG [Proteobacteria bacterium]|nr:endolytic transglycosylase MltG [Pseudomonadota bacterium]
MARFERPRRRGGGVWGFISKFVSLLIVVAVIGFVGMFALQAEITRAGPSDHVADFVVERGASVNTIGRDLQRAGIVRDARVFRVAHFLYARNRSVQAGEYEFPARASLRDVLAMMVDGRALQHPMTFPEGITIAAAMRIIEQSDVLTGPMPSPLPPEGAIMPDTYHVQRGMTRAALIQQLRDARDRAVAEIWASRDPSVPVSTPEQMVTLASIVERETGVSAERAQVAAVFVNRLRRPMRLESDPTIIYGVCKQFPTRCRDGRLVEADGEPRVIRQSEINLVTGYNTYRIDGLPPTPICNPGRDALQAVAHPATSNALYFVADGTGGHVFAATLAEHQANVARWRQIEAQRLAAERAAAAQRGVTPAAAHP